MVRADSVLVTLDFINAKNIVSRLEWIPSERIAYIFPNI